MRKINLNEDLTKTSRESLVQYVEDYIDAHQDDDEQMKKLPVLLGSFFNLDNVKAVKFIDSVMEKLTNG